MQHFVTIHPKHRKHSIVQFHCQHYGFVVFDLSTIEHSVNPDTSERTGTWQILFLFQNKM